MSAAATPSPRAALEALLAKAAERLTAALDAPAPPSAALIECIAHIAKAYKDLAKGNEALAREALRHEAGALPPAAAAPSPAPSARGGPAAWTPASSGPTPSPPSLATAAFPRPSPASSPLLPSSIPAAAAAATPAPSARRLPTPRREQQLLLRRRRRYLFFDTETSGKVLPRVLELAAVTLSAANAPVAQRLPATMAFERLVNPGREVEAGAVAIHGRSNAVLAGLPGFGEVWHAFMEWVRERCAEDGGRGDAGGTAASASASASAPASASGAGASDEGEGDEQRQLPCVPVLVAYNGFGFDVPVLLHELRRLGIEPPPATGPDAVLFADLAFEHRRGTRGPCPSVKAPYVRLSDMHMAVLGEPLADAHTALADARGLCRIYAVARSRPPPAVRFEIRTFVTAAQVRQAAADFQGIKVKAEDREALPDALRLAMIAGLGDKAVSRAAALVDPFPVTSVGHLRRLYRLRFAALPDARARALAWVREALQIKKAPWADNIVQQMEVQPDAALAAGLRCGPLPFGEPLAAARPLAAAAASPLAVAAAAASPLAVAATAASPLAVAAAAAAQLGVGDFKRGDEDEGEAEAMGDDGDASVVASLRHLLLESAGPEEDDEAAGAVGAGGGGDGSGAGGFSTPEAHDRATWHLQRQREAAVAGPSPSSPDARPVADGLARAAASARLADDAPLASLWGCGPKSQGKLRQVFAVEDVGGLRRLYRELPGSLLHSQLMLAPTLPTSTAPPLSATSTRLVLGVALLRNGLHLSDPFCASVLAAAASEPDAAVLAEALRAAPTYHEHPGDRPSPPH